MTTASLERGQERTAAFLDAVSSPGVLYAVFGLATLVLHVAFSGGYGYQRDELYFLACAQHLAWGYVDQPPLIAVIAAIGTTLFGDSLQAIRILPALAAAGTVVLTGVFARRFGAGAFGIAVAMACVLVSPFFLYVGNLLTMNAFEPLLWTAAGLLLVRVIDRDRPSAALWFSLAAVVALGILNKYTMGFYAVCVLAALLMVPQRRILAGPIPALACAALLIAIAPNLWWQQSHGWPQIELLTHAAAFKNPALSPFAFFGQQILMMNPATLPVWIAGLLFLFRGAGGRYRALGIAYVLLFCTFVALHGKIYYLASIYPLLFAAGAAPLERIVNRRWLRIGYAGILAAIGAIIAPQVLPILPLDTFVSYQHVLDFRRIPEEQHPVGRIPQQFADMLGWDTFVATVARAYGDVPAGERPATAIWTRNYGMAGAIDVLGARYGLPKAISGHNNYFIWGTRGYGGQSVLAVGIPRSLLDQEFGRIEPVATFYDPWVLPDENNVPLYWCSDPKRPLAAFWPRVKAYI